MTKWIDAETTGISFSIVGVGTIIARTKIKCSEDIGRSKVHYKNFVFCENLKYYDN